MHINLKNKNHNMANYQPAIFSASLGRAWLHNLDDKLKQAADKGFKGIELFYEDLEYAAKGISKNNSPSSEDLKAAAAYIHQLCQDLGLTILSLQPFGNYDGLLDRAQHDRMIEKLKFWFELAKVLRTDAIGIPANMLPADQVTEDKSLIASDLREIADLGARQDPPIRFAYENLCWSTRIDTWEQAWDMVRRVDRPNFGLCLDTFNIAGRVWGDPTAANGKTANADADLAASLERLVREVDVAKVFYVQIVDAERMETPLVEGHAFYDASQPARMSWSRNARTFMYEEERGAYLPVEKVAKAIFGGLGYKGFVSQELFSRTLVEEGERVPGEHARRGIESWKKCQIRLGLT
ncbi:Uu.00g136270.m01.CDS01 [Anthostomella pinea]|uniref:Uu.00g136270.m01.CDS01 n=1 Tax=Anthostomella pinea TaxID=933095 RepID=A0AAI8VPC1_9PEZI|nr:Uu.00g136270.m01.CDS01 [Anthostomella pinea]